MLSVLFIIFISTFFCYGQQEWEQLLDYTNQQASAPAVYIFEPSFDRKVIYMAVDQTSELEHPTIKKIEEIVEYYRPDMCILEGFNPDEGISPQRILDIAQAKIAHGSCPDNVYAAHLCHERSIPFVGGDIHNQHYVDYMGQKGYSEKDVVFWMLARNFPYWNRDGIVNNENFEQFAANMLSCSIPFWLNRQSLPYTVAEFLIWHEGHMGKPLDIAHDFPWKYDAKEFMPCMSLQATVYQKIQAHIMRLRDAHLISMIDTYSKSHNTVLVILGGLHYDWQKKALEYLFGKSTSTIAIKA